MIAVYAHRGFSGPHPEMTEGAFAAAVELARGRGVALGIECDVHFTADGRLGCLHDRDVSRTGRRVDPGSGTFTPAAGDLVDLTADELAAIDFGAWRDDLDASDEDRRFVHLERLFDLVTAARDEGLEISLAVETKHPVPHDDQVEVELARLLTERGWTGADAPVRMITFDPDAVHRMAGLLPELAMTYLIGRADSWRPGLVPTTVAIGAAGSLLITDPQLLAEVRDAGHEFHVWTINEPEHIVACLDLGLEAITSDHPDRVLDALAERGQSTS